MPLLRASTDGPQTSGSPTAVAYRPVEGDVLAVGAQDGAVRLVDGETLELRLELAGAGAHAIASVSWSADGSVLASADLGGALRLWKAPTREELVLEDEVG